MLFIAEIGMNHNGNLDLAYELIKQAKHAGANVAKFQLGWRDGDSQEVVSGLNDGDQVGILIKPKKKKRGRRRR